MKRQFKSFGFFSRKCVAGSEIDNRIAKSIYEKLLQFGFKKTCWQYVYAGQIGGLVYPYFGDGHDTPNEIHVRFFEDHIFAEFEIGRAYASHFIGPRLNANSMLLKMLGPILSEEETRYFVEQTRLEKLYDDERSMKIWTGGDFFRQTKLRQSRLSLLLLCISIIDIGWKWWLLVALGVFIVSFGGGLLTTLTCFTLGVLGIKFLPSREKP